MYTEIHSNSMDPCSLTKDTYAEAKATWLCLGCVRPKPHIKNVDVRLQEIPRSGMLNFADGCGIPLINKRLLDALPADAVDRELHIGRVSDRHGKESSTWATIRGRHQLIVRGREHVSHRICTECGRHVYFAMGDGYLFPAPPPGPSLFESDKMGLILRDSVFSRLPNALLSGVEVESLPILATPRDGFGVFDMES